MSRILNLGSINLDHVYAVDHFVRPGETLASADYQLHAGGKGYNQTIALARAGADVAHLGAVGEEGQWLVERLAKEGVATDRIAMIDAATGHAIIQVTPEGENAIVLYAGANHAIDGDAIRAALAKLGSGDWLLTQNETSAVAEAMRQAKERGLKIAFNPAPMTDAVHDYPLDLVDLLIVNETEAEALAGESAEGAGAALRKRYPQADVLLTLGSQGAKFLGKEGEIFQAAEKVKAVDTTAAGDTFIGFFLAELLASETDKAASEDVYRRALELGCRASAVCVTRPGAARSIPRRSELA